MIDYFYLLNYESDEDTGLRIMETEPPAAAYLALEDVQNFQTLESTLRLHFWFPQYDVRKCLEALTENDFDFEGAYYTLANREAKEEEDAEART